MNIHHPWQDGYLWREIMTSCEHNYWSERFGSKNECHEPVVTNDMFMQKTFVRIDKHLVLIPNT